MRSCQHATGPRGIEHGAAARLLLAMGRGGWNMVHVDAGAAGAQPGRKGAAEVRRARKRTCHALAEHAMKVAQSADSEGTKRRDSTDKSSGMSGSG